MQFHFGRSNCSTKKSKEVLLAPLPTRASLGLNLGLVPTEDFHYYGQKVQTDASRHSNVSCSGNFTGWKSPRVCKGFRVRSTKQAVYTRILEF